MNADRNTPCVYSFDISVTSLSKSSDDIGGLAARQLRAVGGDHDSDKMIVANGQEITEMY